MCAFFAVSFLETLSAAMLVAAAAVEMRPQTGRKCWNYRMVQCRSQVEVQHLPAGCISCCQIVTWIRVFRGGTKLPTLMDGDGLSKGDAQHILRAHTRRLCDFHRTVSLVAFPPKRTLWT